MYGPPLSEPPDPSSDEARERLAMAAHPPKVVSRADRRISAAIQVTLGVVFGVFVVFMDAVGWNLVALVLLAVASSALNQWQTHRRTLPRRVKLLSTLVIPFTVAAAVLGLVVLNSQAGEPSVWVRALVVAVIAAPEAVVAMLILREGR